MTILVIGALSLSGKCANTLCKELFAESVYPLEAEVENLTAINLALPEARLHLKPLATASVVFPDFARLQRAVSSLRQIAELNQMADIVSISAGEQVEEPEKAPETDAEQAARLQAEAEAKAKADEEEAARLAALQPKAVIIVQDDEKGYVVELDGIRFTPNRNQVRDDGTLTAGGVKIYETAKAEAEAK